MRALHTLLVALALAVTVSVFVAPVHAQSASQPPYRVIVNPVNPVAALERRFVEEAFLKKVTRWPTDVVIRPVDLAPSSPVRRRFTEDVLDRSIEAVKGYWQQRIFAGRDVPPPEVDTDEDVVRYVHKYEGAIGYVSGNANVDGLKVVAVK